MLVSDIGFPRRTARMASGMEPAQQTALKEAEPGGWAIGRNKEEINCRGVFYLGDGGCEGSKNGTSGLHTAPLVLNTSTP
jgi:hypothetical protein